MSARLTQISRRPAEESWGTKAGDSGAAFDDAGHATLKAWSEGPFNLDILLGRRRVGGYISVNVLRRQVEVGEGVQTVSLEVDDELLARIESAIERLRRMP